jgi:DNA-binding PadR family transcriptional regulator
MSTRYAVLGLLLERRGYGYQLVQRLNERLGPAWQLTPSSVYAAVDQLQTDGLVEPIDRSESTAIPLHATRGRVVYEPTEAGHDAFAAWVGKPSMRQEPIRSELQLKVAVARPEDVPALLEAIEHERAMAETLAAECAEAASQFGAGNDGASKAAALVRAAAHARLSAEIAWLRHARQTLEAVAADAEAPAALLAQRLN